MGQGVIMSNWYTLPHLRTVMKKFLFILIIIAGLGLGTSFGLHVFGDNPDSSENVLSAQSQRAPKPTGEKKISQFIVPVRISIPSLNLDTEVESIGKDATGAMDVPEKFNNAGWYNLGAKPGQTGNAVIAGHYDRVDGSPAAFWDVPKLKKGDEVQVTDEAGTSLTFRVVAIVNYQHDSFPLEEVFGDSSRKRLNLITCQGDWDEDTKLYSERMVVYTELVE